MSSLCAGQAQLYFYYGTGINLIRIWSNDGFSWTRWWTFTFCKSREIYLPAGQLSGFQTMFCTMEL